MERDIDELELDTAAKCRQLIEAVAHLGHPLVVVSTYRTPEEQGKLYKQGRTAPGRVVTNARAGRSWHNYRRAFDVAWKSAKSSVSWDGPWEMLGTMGESLGLKWGGRFRSKDLGHFEWHGDHTLEELYDAWQRSNSLSRPS